jgi:restriction system protein
MAIPDYQSIMLPLLRFAEDRKDHSLREAINTLALEFGLTEEERSELLPSGKQPTFDNRVGWARTYMEKAGLLEKPKRAFFKITKRGLDVLASNPDEINVQFLEQYDEFVEFRQVKREKNDKQTAVFQLKSETPEEALEAAHQTLKENLSSEIVQTIKQCSPEFFERLVVDLIVKMGYGGSRKEAGQAMGKSGDGGIDGIIKEDRLGLDIIYIQAKRWEGVVGRPEIQKFAGALQGHRAKKGIFLTTSNYTKDAMDYVSHIDTKIILVDGSRLAELMIEHNVGATPIASYEVKRLDSDYFAEE